MITKTTPRSDNTFDFTNLRKDTYLISSFEDINGDLEYDFKKELFDEQLVSIIYPVQSVDLKLTLQDTTKPELKKIISKLYLGFIKLVRISKK